MTEGTTMPAERNATCSSCVWRYDNQCRRYPPVTSLEVTGRTFHPDRTWKDEYGQKTYFPVIEMQTFCGEHKAKESTHE